MFEFIKKLKDVDLNPNNLEFKKVRHYQNYVEVVEGDSTRYDAIGAYARDKIGLAVHLVDLYSQDDVETFKAILKEVYNLAIQDAADNADADVNWLRDDLMSLEEGEDYEVYTLKESILGLKNK